jgi:hypothetical protein
LKLLTLGLYENFPPNIHRIDRFNHNLSSKQLQIKLVSVLKDVNGGEYSFEEIANPTVPNGRVIFEFGLAESGDFNYIDEEEVKKTQSFLSKERLPSMDFFCSIRYYKVSGEKRSALKFDYYLMRALFSKNLLEIQVFHERGPRYVSPEELTDFILTKLNANSTKKILHKQAT